MGSKTKDERRTFNAQHRTSNEMVGGPDVPDGACANVCWKGVGDLERISAGQGFEPESWQVEGGKK